MKGEFKQAVEKITGLKITDRESEYLFKMVDANHDGIIDAENELNLHKHRTPEYVSYGREQTEILLNDQNHAWVIIHHRLHICQTLFTLIDESISYESQICSDKYNWVGFGEVC